MSRAHGRRAIAALMVALSSLAGCSGAKVLKPNENDRLRGQVNELNAKVEDLTRQKVQLEQQLAVLTKQMQEAAGVDPAIAAVTPRLAQVRIGSESHYQCTQPGQQCLARVYLEPQDGLGRFLQVVGSVEVSVFQLTAAGESARLGHGSFDLIQVRDAWRGGIMGSHYTFELPLACEQWNGTGDVTVKLEFVDATTGRHFSVQREIHKSK